MRSPTGCESWPRVVVAATCAALVAGGCGGTVDTAQIEEEIEASVSARSATVTTAECPADVEAGSEAAFTCKLAFSNGATGKATVTPVGGRQFEYALEPGSLQVPGEVMDAAVEQRLAAQGATDATVDCPENVIVKTSTTVTCAVGGAQGAASGTVTFTFSDDEGTVEPSSVKSS